MAPRWLTNILRLPKRLGRSLRGRGLFATLRLCQDRLFIHLKRCSPTGVRISKSEERFDGAFGVDTKGILALTGLDVPYSSKAEAYHYQASNPFVFGEMMKSLGVDCRDYTFVDVGSGKGRVLLMASVYGFKRVIGIEFARELHEAALHNVAHYTERPSCNTKIESVHADAAQWLFPSDKLVVYLFNPFGPGLLAALLANLRESLKSQPREVYFLYSHPVHEQVLRESSFLSRVGHSAKLDFVIYGARLPI